MEALLELDDDIFYKDLGKQISLLIMDDDDDDEGSLAHCASVNLEAFNQAIHLGKQCSILNFDSQNERKGTGVFIPRPRPRSYSSRTRRKKVKRGRTAATAKSRPQRSLKKMSYSDNVNNNPSRDHYSVNL